MSLDVNITKCYVITVEFPVTSSDWDTPSKLNDNLIRQKRQGDEDGGDELDGGEEEEEEDTGPAVTGNATTAAGGAATTRAGGNSTTRAGGASSAAITSTVTTVRAASSSTASQITTVLSSSSTATKANNASVTATTSAANKTTIKSTQTTQTTKKSETTTTTALTFYIDTTEVDTKLIKPLDTKAHVQPGFICTTDLFKKADNCCPTPTLITEDEVQSCVSYGRSKRQVFKQLMDFFLRPRGTNNMRIPINNGPQYEDTPMVFSEDNTNANVDQICLVECIFLRKKWLRQDDRINWELIFIDILSKVPSFWSPFVNAARKNCQTLMLSPDAIALMPHPNGHYCLELPTKIIRCIKRDLALNCPTFVSSTLDCYETMSELNSCDVSSL